MSRLIRKRVGRTLERIQFIVTTKAVRRIIYQLPILLQESEEMIMSRRKLAGTWFCGNEASDYAKEQGYLDYATLAKGFDAVMNNGIMEMTEANGIGYWEQENGEIDNSDEIEELENQIEEVEEKMENVNEDSDDYNAFEREIDEMNDRINKLQNQQDYPPEVFQWFIVDENGADIIKEYTDDPLYYNEELDMYVWGVTHYVTAWDNVLTDIQCEIEE